jgi:hypothetical protein
VAAKAAHGTLDSGAIMHINRVILGGASSLACGLLGGSEALADATSPGDLTAGGYVQEFNYEGYNDVHALYGAGSAQVGRAFLDVQTAPGGAVLVSTPSGTPNAFFATGSESYYAEIQGPVENDIPVRLYFDLYASGGAPASYNAASVVFDTTFYQIVLHNTDAAQHSSSYLTQYLSTNTPFKISIGASSEYGGTAYADPMLEIDPTWAMANPDLASQLSLSFSSGIQNGLGDLAGLVPEPAAWVMMILGMGMVGGTLRRLSRQALSA